ncbi:hypothetical protein AGLY_011726 [Aphis glycines]|uniref:Uncharacterized protein n=1 Tax=Aphis glycines TaxID=307491 RepID=A0A6G0TD84_APHGL|nr:hypothetical protein AGLY_011726 [Aphis glycines]
MPCGSVGQFGAVNVKPLSHPASIGSAYIKIQLPFTHRSNESIPINQSGDGIILQAAPVDTLGATKVFSTVSSAASPPFLPLKLSPLPSSNLSLRPVLANMRTLSDAGVPSRNMQSEYTTVRKKGVTQPGARPIIVCTCRKQCPSSKSCLEPCSHQLPTIQRSNSERSDKCIDFTMMGGFRWQSEYSSITNRNNA